MGISYFNYLYDEINNNLNLYITILIVIFIIYILCLRKHVYSIFDPINFMILACVFSTADVIFMYIKDMISGYYFYHYLITEIIMIIGIMLISPINFKEIAENGLNNVKNMNIKNEDKINNLSYIIISLLFNICSMIVYSKVGFMLFNKTNSRLGLGDEAGGAYTIIGYIIIVYGFLIVMRFLKKTNLIFRTFDIINLTLFILYCITSGAKSSFIEFIFAIFYYIMYLKKNNKFRNKKIIKINVISYILLIVCVICAIVIANITTGNEGVFDAIIYRLIAYGDVYPMYYIPSINYVGGDFFNGMLLMFYPFIGMIQKVVGIFHIQLVEEFPKLIGLQIYQTLFNTDVIQGPNSRHTIFGLFYFGYFGSVIFSFTLGIFIGICRNKLYKCTPNNVFWSIIYVIFSLNAITNVTDPSVGMVRLIQSLVYYLIIYGICYVTINSVSLKRFKVSV